MSSFSTTCRFAAEGSTLNGVEEFLPTVTQVTQVTEETVLSNGDSIVTVTKEEVTETITEENQQPSTTVTSDNLTDGMDTTE